ncbi:MAG: 3'-5' exoribonuclease [Clostridiales bacterium]|nr:3'-5' exoribonuclease [Clostridiales bacterium]
MQKRFTVPPPEGWTRLEGQQLLAYLKEYKLIPNSATEPKKFLHIDAISKISEPCTVVGYADQWAAVIDIGGELSCIDPEFLKEMQPKAKASLSDQVLKTVTFPSEYKRICVFDVETPNSNSDRICSIGLLLLENGVETDSFYSVVNPETHFDLYNMGVNDITPDQAEISPTFPQIWEKIQPFFKNTLLVAHNAPYDISVLKKTFSFYGLPELPVSYACTLNMSKQMYPEFCSHALNVLCDEFHIELDHHNAESDTRACAKILLKMLEDGLDLSAHIKTCVLSDPLVACNQSCPDPAEEPVIIDIDSYFTIPKEPLDIVGKSVCTTGDFDYGDKEEVHAMLSDLGAVVRKSVVKNLSYLIVGNKGSDAWSCGCYGTKIQKALENQQNGSNVKIIRESVFFEALKSTNTEILNEDQIFSKIESVLTSAGYHDLKIKLDPRNPGQSKPYYVINFCNKTCLRFNGEVIKYAYIMPAMKKACQAIIPIQTMKNQPWPRFPVAGTDWDALAPLWIEMYEYCLFNSADGFDCCSRYEQCSDAKQCIHPDQTFAGGCRYRQRLRKGIIYYGRNRNV